MKFFLLVCAAAALLGETRAETKFEKCSTIGENRKDLCFKTKMNEIVAKVGPDGTDEDVVMEVCSDVDTTDCCKTDALDRTLRDDWSKNDDVTYGRSKFGKVCKNKIFKVKRGLYITLSKSGEKDSLIVNNLELHTISPDSKNPEKEKFKCGRFDLGTRNQTFAKQTKFCIPGPFLRVFEAKVKIGNDGTDDNVKVGICGDGKTPVCCEKKLSHTFADDWVKNKEEKWPASQFGDCAKKLFKVQEKPKIYLTKSGKDDLKVAGFEIWFDMPATPLKRMKLTCPGFTVAGNCRPTCEHTLANCRKTLVPAIGGTTTTTKRPRTTKRTTTRRTTRPTTTISSLRASSTTTQSSTTKKSLSQRIFGALG